MDFQCPNEFSARDGRRALRLRSGQFREPERRRVARARLGLVVEPRQGWPGGMKCRPVRPPAQSAIAAQASVIRTKTPAAERPCGSESSINRLHTHCTLLKVQADPKRKV
jgi:hypothetical protein